MPGIGKMAIAVVSVAFAAGLALAAHQQPEVQRLISGTVSDRQGEPLRKAVVQLKNLRTLQVLSFITQKDGRYHFAGTSTETDYELRVLYRGKFSDPKKVTHLNSREHFVVDFHIEVPDQ
jgi:hypothetical protein